MAAGELLFTRVAIVDKHGETAAIAKELRNAIDPVEGGKGDLDALALFGMHAVMVDVVELVSGWRIELFDESSLLFCDSDSTTMIDDLHRKCVEELVGKEDQRCAVATRLERICWRRSQHSGFASVLG